MPEAQNGAGKKPFKPWPPMIARAMAHQAYLLYQSNPELVADKLNKPGSPCSLCTHVKFEEIAFLLLAGATARKLRRTINSHRNYHQVRRLEEHRDQHLIRVINDYLIPNSDALKMMPFPVDGNSEQKGLYYLYQHMGLYYQALDAGQFLAANSILKEMRVVDKEYLVGKKIEKQALPGETPIPDVLADFSARDEKLNEAFRRSSAKPEAVDGSEAQNQPGDQEVA